jgi:predicted HAD superfamily phosphohydrolase YqeG
MGALTRILDGFTLGFRHRMALRQLLNSTAPETSIMTLDPEALRASGIEALALDFDGVLAGHGLPEPLPEAIAWMKRCEAVFGGDRVFILSNKPTEGRRKWFATQFPNLRFIAGVRKKPYPDGIATTAQLAGVPASAILMVDDRLLTGCLAALLAGARPCYIRNPYTSCSHRPVAELFFRLLRMGERLFVRLIT